MIQHVMIYVSLCLKDVIIFWNNWVTISAAEQRILIIKQYEDTQFMHLRAQNTSRIKPHVTFFFLLPPTSEIKSFFSFWRS